MLRTDLVRRLGTRLPAFAAGGLAAIVVQGYHAGHRSLPHFADVDASGVIGRQRQPLIRVAALGDSTLTGPGLAQPSHMWLRKILDESHHIGLSLQVFARGGAKTRDVLATQLEPAITFAPQVAVVSVGSNDAIRGVSIGSMESDLRTIIAALRSSGAMVVLMGVGDLATIPRLPQPLATMARIRGRLSDRVQGRLADETKDVVKVPMFEIAGPVFRSTDNLFVADLFHPNRDGQNVWADAARPTMLRVLQHVSRLKEPR